MNYVKMFSYKSLEKRVRKKRNLYSSNPSFILRITFIVFYYSVVVDFFLLLHCSSPPPPLYLSFFSFLLDVARTQTIFNLMILLYSTSLLDATAPIHFLVIFPLRIFRSVLYWSTHCFSWAPEFRSRIELVHRDKVKSHKSTLSASHIKFIVRSNSMYHIYEYEYIYDLKILCRYIRVCSILY